MMTLLSGNPCARRPSLTISSLCSSQCSHILVRALPATTAVVTVGMRPLGLIRDQYTTKSWHELHSAILVASISGFGGHVSRFGLAATDKDIYLHLLPHLLLVQADFDEQECMLGGQVGGALAPVRTCGRCGSG